MALDPSARYPSQIDDTDAAYPHGKAQNKSGPDTNDGTPYEADVVNDLWGFQQELLSEAGITPSGNPDEVGTSDYVDALDTLYYRKADADAKFHEDGDNATLADLTVTGAFVPASGYLLKSIQVFTASGTWNKPSDVRAVRAIAVGGGGGSGGADSPLSDESYTSGGGGGGGTAVKFITAPGASETVTVGGGGPAGSSTPSDGQPGDPSSFGAHITGGGGGGGKESGASRDGGDGGTASGGDENIRGDDGGPGAFWDGFAFALLYGGAGGGSTHSGSRRGDNIGALSGHLYGGGASGTNVGGNGSSAGAAGADGIVIIEEYV